MISDEPHHRMDAARVRAGLTVQDLWLRYLALGGTSDAFEIDGYLQGVFALDTFQHSVLAQAVNEALQDSYDSYAIAMDAPPPHSPPSDDHLRRIISELLKGLPAAPDNGP